MGSKLPEFLQDKSCFDGRPSPSVSEDFLKEFYAKENERKKHMKVCPGCGKYFSRLYRQQKQELIDEELIAGGWVL